MFSVKKEKLWIKISLMLIVVVFLGLNLYSTFRYGPSNYLGSLEKFNNDDVKYIRSAWELVDKGHFIYRDVGSSTVYIMPGLPYALAFFVSIFGKFGGITAFRVFQSLLQACSLYLIFLIGRKIFNSKAALIACLLSSLSAPEYYTNTIILTEVLFKFFLLLLIYVSIYAIEERKINYYIWGGLVWALGCLVRPTIAPFPIVILVMWIIKKYTLKEMLKFGTITALVFAIVMSPWWIRNYKVFNRFIPLTLSTGNPFLQGTYVDYDEEIDHVSYDPGNTELEKNESEINCGLYRLKTFAPRQPLKYAYWYTIGKTREFWKYPFYWEHVLGVDWNTALAYHKLVLTLAIFGSLILFMKKNRNFLMLFITVVFFNLIHLPYITMSRYAYPIMPVVMIIAGYAVYEYVNLKLMASKQRAVFASKKNTPTML